MKVLKIYTDLLDTLEDLGDAERGRLFTAMLKYSLTGEIVKLGGNERFIWAVVKQNIDRQKSKYDSCLENGKKGGRPSREKVDGENPIKPNITQHNPKKPSKTQNKDKDKDKDILPNGNINPLTPLEGALEDFKAFRKSIKSPLTDRAVKLLRDKLDELSGGDEAIAVEIINQSIVQGWKGVFPLKDDLRSQGAKHQHGYEEHTFTKEQLDALLVDLDGEGGTE